MYKEMFYTEDLINSAEELVFEEIHKTILSGNVTFCQCDVCVQDIAAIVLNNIPCCYENSFLERINPGDHQIQRQNELRGQIARALPDAIKIVSQNAHH